MNIDEMHENEARDAVHTAVMVGFERAGVRYESDGATYCVKFADGILCLSIDNCNK